MSRQNYAVPRNARGQARTIGPVWPDPGPSHGTTIVGSLDAPLNPSSCWWDDGISVHQLPLSSTVLGRNSPCAHDTTMELQRITTPPERLATGDKVTGPLGVTRRHTTLMGPGRSDRTPSETFNPDGNVAQLWASLEAGACPEGVAPRPGPNVTTGAVVSGRPPNAAGPRGPSPTGRTPLRLQLRNPGGGCAITIPSSRNGGRKPQYSDRFSPRYENRKAAAGWFHSKWRLIRGRKRDHNPSISQSIERAHSIDTSTCVGAATQAGNWRRGR